MQHAAPPTVNTDDTMQDILIIKHSALGDMVLATAAMKALHQHFTSARFTLLTASPYHIMMKDCPWFDDIICDVRPKWWQAAAVLRLKKQLRSRPWSWVFDLQTSTRSTQYFNLLTPEKPNVSGLARHASHCHDTPHRTTLHTLDRHREQLDIAGIDQPFMPDISWLGTGSAIMNKVARPFALIVPGGSAHRPEKRYPAQHYAVLCETLLARGLTPVLLGTKAESPALDVIMQHAPDCINLCDATSFGDIAQLARHAFVAIGNDTGPIHMIAAANCPTITLFSHASNPALCAPRGEHVSFIQREDLSTVTTEEIIALLPPDPQQERRAQATE